MTIMHYGSGRQGREWYVTEKKPPQYLRIYWMQGGSVLYRDAREEKILKQGMLYVFPAQQPYEMTQDPQNPIDCVYLHADVFPWVLNHLLELDPEKNEDILCCLQLLRRRLEKPNPSVEIVENMAQTLLHLIEEAVPFEKEAASPLIGESFVSLSDTTVRKMSRKAGYTTEYYIRSFSKAVGMTPYQYLLAKRMNEAVSLMRQGMMLDEVALKVGYASGKSFAGAFKRRFGISPDEYRKHFLKKA